MLLHPAMLSVYYNEQEREVFDCISFDVVTFSICLQHLPTSPDLGTDDITSQILALVRGYYKRCGRRKCHCVAPRSGFAHMTHRSSTTAVLCNCSQFASSLHPQQGGRLLLTIFLQLCSPVLS